MLKLAPAIITMSLLLGSTSAVAQCAATSNGAVAEKIANGHSWGKHRNEFVAGTVIAKLAMPAIPKITTIAEFKLHILSIMSSTTNKALSSARKAFWGSSTGTIVIYDPVNFDCGTAFRPVAGKRYYDRQN